MSAKPPSERDEQEEAEAFSVAGHGQNTIASATAAETAGLLPAVRSVVVLKKSDPSADEATTAGVGGSASAIRIKHRADSLAEAIILSIQQPILLTTRPRSFQISCIQSKVTQPNAGPTAARETGMMASRSG